jgi:hypothetical protein
MYNTAVHWAVPDGSTMPPGRADPTHATAIAIIWTAASPVACEGVDHRPSPMMCSA